MNNPADLSYLGSWAALFPPVQDYFVHHVLTWAMGGQIIAMGVAFALAYGVSEYIRPRLLRHLERHPLLGNFLANWRDLIAGHLTRQVMVIVLLWIELGVAYHFNWRHHGIRVVLSLMMAWVIIRLVTSQMKNTLLARFMDVTIWSIAALYILHLINPTIMILKKIDFNIGNIKISLFDIIDGLLILMVLLWLAKAILNIFHRWITMVENVTPAVQVLLEKLFKIVLLTSVVFIVLYHLGINITAFAWFSGAMGLGIGFGLQRVFANLISGFMILADKSIKPGDVIQLGDTYGRINFLGARHISVITRDATEHLIPNEDLITGQVVNWSYSSNLLRLKVPVGISYDADLQQAMALMLDAAAATPRILAEPKPACLLMGFGDYAVNLQLRVWIQDPQDGVANVKSELLMGIWERFHEHGIELPYPQQVLHHKVLAPGVGGAICSPGEGAVGHAPEGAE